MTIAILSCLREKVTLMEKYFCRGSIPSLCRSQSHPEVFPEKGLLKICSKFKGEHPCRSAISIKLQSNFIEITLFHGVFLKIYCIFSENFFLRKPLVDCFWLYYAQVQRTYGLTIYTMTLILEKLSFRKALYCSC